MTTNKVKGYEDRDISEELKDMFYRRVNDVAASMQSTSTKIKVKLAPVEERLKKVEKGHRSLTKVFRDLFRKGIGDIDEHVMK
jgi:hypothetical protein